MADYTSSTPGSEVASQLQEILARKKAEQRQQMVDQVSLVNQQSQMANQAENTRSLGAQREALTAKTKMDMDNQTRYRQTIDKFMADPNFAKMTPEDQNAYRIASADPSGDLFKTLLARDPMMAMQVFDEQSGKISNATGPDGQPVMTRGTNRMITRNRPPQPNATNAPSLYQAPDPNNPGQNVSYWLRPGEQPNEQNRILGAPIRKGNEPPAKPKPRPTGGELNALAKARGLATDGTGLFGGKATEQNKAAYDQMVNNMVTRYGADPDVINAVVQASQQYDPSVPTADIVKAHSEGNSPEQLQEFAEMLMVIRGAGGAQGAQ